jgi:transcription elongation factor Elf1
MTEGGMIPIACPRCGKTGAISAKLLPAVGSRVLTCPSCKESFECSMTPEGTMVTRDREVFSMNTATPRDSLVKKILQKTIPTVHTRTITTEKVSTKTGILACPGCGSNNVAPKEGGEQTYTRTVVYDSATGTKKEEAGKPPIFICLDCGTEWECRPEDIHT